MGKTFDAYKACEDAKTREECEKTTKEDACSYLEGTLRLEYPQYRILVEAMEVLEREVKHNELWCRRDTQFQYGVDQCIFALKSLREKCKKEIIEAERCLAVVTE
jgi:hypothetical protein